MRGGILDVFPPTEDHPVRVEFWGDTVEAIRWFKVADQRSLERAEHGLWAPPCREVLLADSVRERARALMDQLPGAALRPLWKTPGWVPSSICMMVSPPRPADPRASPLRGESCIWWSSGPRRRWW